MKARRLASSLLLAVLLLHGHSCTASLLSERWADRLWSLAQQEPVFVAAAQLSGENVLPEPTNTTATGGIALAIFNSTALFILELFDFPDLTYAHLHYGNSSTNGLPIVLLAPTEHNDDIHTALDPPMSGSMGIVGTFNASQISSPAPGVTITLPALKESILAGQIYCAVHNVLTNPVGLIRGQLEEYRPPLVLPWGSRPE